MIEPLDIETIRERYAATPREIDSRLRPITRLEFGEAPPFPAVRLVVVLLLLSAATYGVALWFEFEAALGFMLASPLLLGAGIQVVRAGSATVQVQRALETAPLVLGGVVRAHNTLYRSGVEPEEAVVVFACAPERRFDQLYLRDLTKALRAAAEDPTPASDLAPAVVRVTEPGPPVPLPERVAGDGDAWLARVLVVPDRLPDNKIKGNLVPLLVDPESGLVAHI